MEKPLNPCLMENKPFPQDQHSSSSTTTSTRKHPRLTMPDEIVREILSRLPVKSLLRFECVSKVWLSLISSPEFINAHLKFNQKNQRVLNEGYDLNVIGESGFYLKHCSLNSSLEGQVDPADTINLYNFFHKVTNCVFVDFFASCNGLVFTATYDTELFLWNPSTRKSKKLPDLGLPLYRISNDDYDIMYGFGYDECSDDYKVAAVIHDNDNRDPSSWPEVKVYSTKAKSWKRVGEFRGYCPNDSSVFANGKIYWQSSSSRSNALIFLDLATETFGEVEVPNDGYKGHPSLGTFEGNLCLIYHFSYRNVVDLELEVWVMKENSFGKSWSRLLSLPRNDQDNCLSTILRISSNGEFLCVFNRNLGLYNPKDYSFKHVKGIADDNIVRASVFIESLVSPGV